MFKQDSLVTLLKILPLAVFGVSLILEFMAGDWEVGAFGIAPVVGLAVPPITGTPDAPVNKQYKKSELNETITSQHWSISN